MDRPHDSQLPTLTGDTLPAEQPPPPPELDGYRITGRLGHGGMGEVWRAVQLSTKHAVALKLISGGAAASEKARRRFEREVELAAGLEHPHIARVYDSGLHHGVYFYAMELIDGAELTRYVAREKLSARQILELMRLVAEAVQHAHQHGVIHRDLKPSNILVSPGGQPRVLDFGLAKSLLDDGALEVTEDDGIAGTLPYMSPEQAAGRVTEVDTRTDVYALGVILYQLLTGCLPREMSGTKLEALNQMARGEVIRPRQRSRHIDADLEAVLLKALALDRDQRYPSAGPLADDLGNYLAGEPVRARKPTTLYFLRKRLRKYRVQVSAAAAVLIATIAAAGFYVHSIKAEQARTLRERNVAIRMKDLAVEHRRIALEAVSSLVFEVQRRLSEHGGQGQLREALLGIARDKLRQIAEQSPTDAPLVDRNDAAAMLSVGDILKQTGDLSAARQACTQAVQRFEALASTQPAWPQARRDLCVAHRRLGWICLAMGEPRQGQRHFEQAIGLLEDLARQRPDDPAVRRDRWALQIALGDVAVELNDPAAARSRYAESLATATALGRAVSLKRLGEADVRLGHPDRAADSYRQAVQIDRTLADSDGNNPRRRQDLAGSLAKLGEAETKTGHAAPARSHFAEALAILEELVAQDPARFDTKADLAATAFMRAELEAASGAAAEAARWYGKCRSILTELDEAGKLADQPRYEELLRRCTERLAPATQPG